jgi:RHS repeat-associated protein
MADRGSGDEPPRRAAKPAEGASATPAIRRGIGTAAPTQSLPKGGGAIRGIGETFTANAITGTGTLRVPIAATPARSGFHPEISLSYDSGAGNGPFGVGWHLSVPAISRRTDKKIPEYKDSEASDVFLFSADDLIPALIETASGWVPDVVDTPELRIERYRPRIEGMFARIERRTRKADGDVRWEAITRDNVKLTYGATPASRIADPWMPRRIFSWLLSRTEDARGNVIVYEYKPEDLANVALTLPEKYRLRGEVAITNRYLKRIRYGNTTPGDESTCVFELVFDYGEHHATRPTPAEVSAWPSRQDPFSIYRASFEVRTYRLCRRVLMFHRFPELGAEPCLVRSTDFGYAENTTLTRLVSVTQAGYIRVGGGVYSGKQLPPLELDYSLPKLSRQPRALDWESIDDLPIGVDGRWHRWADLDGEGVPGVFSQQGGALTYKRNLGKGRLAPARTLETQPSMAALAGRGQVLDIDADGRKEMVFFEQPDAGYFERTDEGWGPFVPFLSQPNVDWNDPNLRFIDLNGDGLDDILIARDDVFVWYPSEAQKGFGPPRTFARPRDEEKGPTLLVADLTQAIFLADMSGDGLADIVRITNTSICYWPNLGHGRFGAKVTMAQAPVFDRPDWFHPGLIRLGDIDGSGTTDVFYIGRDEGVRYWLNQAGNAWGPENKLLFTVAADVIASVAIVDLFGTGTGCLVWSTSLSPGVQPRMFAIDFLGGQKPYLLTGVRNNLGMETRIAYAPSTRFYLEDRAAGRPWVTRLPFPVQVLERVETYDAVRRVRFVSSYKYHHGYYDGVEREFRGFGLVEQWDTESSGAAHGKGLFPEMPAPVNGEAPQPPVYTKTWFHTGAWRDGGALSRQFAREYYAGDKGAVVLPDTVFLDELLSKDLATEELRDACRALKGQVLRQEVYGLDGSAAVAHPYTVSEHTYGLRRVQPAQTKARAVFFAHPREEIAYHYERDPGDPRIGHTFTLEVDEYGSVLRTAAVGYPRRTPSPEVPEQGKLLITCTENDVADLTGALDAYRAGFPIESRTYELTLAEDVTGALSFDQVASAAQGATPIAYEAEPTAGKVEKRLLSRSKTRYFDRTKLPAPLPFGQIDTLALPFEHYALAFTPELLADRYADRVTNAILAEGGYVALDGEPGWWVPSGRAIPGVTDAGGFHVAPFFLPRAVVDPFDKTTSVTYDDYALLVKETHAPLGNVVGIENDYRTMAPAQVTDPNGNRTAARFDELGMVVATAVMGKAENPLGDTLDKPTTTFEYDFFDAKTGRPNVAHARARETHGRSDTRWQESYSYSDGAGHEVMKKVQAEPGQAPQRDGSGKLVYKADGTLDVEHTDARWVGTGRTVLNNKGNPIKQYEPFFSSTHAYEDEDDLVQWGVTPILHYDPLGRLIRTDLPNGTCSRVSFSPWREESWDANDTINDPGNAWYAARQPAAIPAMPASEQRAATLAAAHAGTPSVTLFDTLGRAIVAIADLGGGKTIETRTALDIEGNPLVIRDPRKLDAMEHAFDMLGRTCWQRSIDAGERWAITNVVGNPLRTWDSRGHVLRPTYDALHRPTGLWVQTNGGPEALAERTIYGEELPSPELLNLRGKVHQQNDGAGLVTHEAYDFKGNPLSVTRQLAKNYKGAIGSEAAADPPVVGEPLDWSGSPEVEAETFTTTTTYDALNRVTSRITPDRSLTRSGYNEAGLVERVDVWLRDAWDKSIPLEELTSPSTSPVVDIDYNAKGQREKIRYGNGVVTEYVYDPLTFRLSRLRTNRNDGSGALLQDLEYTYDPVGNVAEIHDGAQKTVYNNGVVEPVALYGYDATYRLTSAHRREHSGQNADIQQDENGFPLVTAPHPNDPQALRNYAELYSYDDAGNIQQMKHVVAVGSGGWTRRYEIDPTSNRLLSTSLPGDGPGPHYGATYGHDAHGNMTSMPHLAHVGWDFKDQMVSADKSGGGLVYFAYDAAGERVRKVWEHNGLVEERIYLGGYEVYRKRQGGAVVLERQTLHAMDSARRVALIETKTIDADAPPFTPTPRVRYQLGNHLGSAVLELDEGGQVISYEEYHPYGTTAYRAATGDVEVSAKRYRYTGKERDEETGLYYHGARYYAPWLGRWTSADPAGMVDGPSAYTYCGNSPTNYVDRNGAEKSVGELNYEIYRLHRDLIARAQASGAPSELVASLQATAEVFKRLAIQGPGGESGLPLAAAFGGSAAFPALKPPTVRSEAPDSIRPLMALSNQAAPRVQAGTVRGMQAGALIAMTLPGAAAAGAVAMSGGAAAATGGGAAAKGALYAKAGPTVAAVVATGSQTPAGQELIREAGEIAKAEGPVIAGEVQAIVRTEGPVLAGEIQAEAQAVRAAIDTVPKSLFEALKCDKCAQAMVEALKQRGISGEILDIKNKGKFVGMSSDLLKFGTEITQNGFHQAVRVGNMVYDNFLKQGVPYDEYMKALHSPMGYTVTKTPF